MKTCLYIKLSSKFSKPCCRFACRFSASCRAASVSSCKTMRILQVGKILRNKLYSTLLMWSFCSLFGWYDLKIEHQTVAVERLPI